MPLISPSSSLEILGIQHPLPLCTDQAFLSPLSHDDNSPAQLRHPEAYRSLIGSIGWLATATRPDLATVHSFLSFYSNKPSSGHMQAVLYTLRYIHLTHDHGITFSSKATAPIHSYIHFPDSAYVEA